MKISIIIPTLNEQRNLPRLIKDLTAQTLTPHQIIIVDGGSTDNTIKNIKSGKNLRLIQTHSGVGHQRQTGADQATGDLLIFLDADVRIPADFSANLIQHHRSHHWQIAIPRYLPYNQTTQQKSAWHIYLTYQLFNGIFYLSQRFSPSGAGSCIIITKQLFNQINGLNPQLPYEDIDLIRRASKQGKFQQLPYSVRVSDRRWQRDGYFQTLYTYLRLSWKFLHNDFDDPSDKYSFEYKNYS